ncbi:hypothetical protein [Brevundimonas sp. DC300-4]|uniref:hypothetical protein n=1 Tax=Brevundimonas sp. DC300-4 TaxID=2804594 RepID=UPI003CE7ED59
MKTAMIRKALLPVLAASAVLVSTPALAQSVGVTLSFGSPGYAQDYGYGRGYGQDYGYSSGYAPQNLRYRAQALSQHIERLAWTGALHRREARALSRQLQQYQSLEYQYARNGLSGREYYDLNARLDRIEYQVQRVQHARW